MRLQLHRTSPSLCWQSADAPSGILSELHLPPLHSLPCPHLRPQSTGRYGSNRPCRCSYAFTGTWRRFRFQNRANQAVAGSRTPRAFLASCLPHPHPNATVWSLRLAAAPHARARSLACRTRYRALHRAIAHSTARDFSLSPQLQRARSLPYHCSCGPAFN